MARIAGGLCSTGLRIVSHGITAVVFYMNLFITKNIKEDASGAQRDAPS